MGKMKIVFLDASTIDYGDVDFGPIGKLGEFTKYDITKTEHLEERLKSADIVITNKVIINKNIMDICTGLKFIAVAATGYNNVDVQYAASKGIPVANVPGYSTGSVAQLTVNFILSLSTGIINYNSASHDGTWSRSDIFTMGDWPTFELSGKTLGIMGMGAIGKRVAEIASFMGMRIAAHKRDGVFYSDEYERFELFDLAGMSDFISIHMPLTEYSEKLVDRKFLKRMKKSSCLINMARGEIVEPAALEWALNTGEIAGAAIDVMDKEPPAVDNPLLKTKNLIITPHIAWASIESRMRLIEGIAENIRSFINGQKRNIVNLC